MSKRYFINNIDSFLGQQLLSELYKAPEEGEADAGDFKIMATYTTPHRLDKQPGVKKILKRYKPKLSRKKMLEENDVWIYDTSSLEDLKFAVDILDQIPQLEEPKVLILVSDVRTWGKTPRKQKLQIFTEKKDEEVQDVKQVEVDENEDLENQQENQNEDIDEIHENKEDIPVKHEEEVEKIVYEQLREGDYQSRVPLELFQHFKDMEEMVLGLQKENLKAIVICPGMFFGAGEIIFKNHFQAAWKQYPNQLPYLGTGENNIPTINVKDLIKFVIKVSETPPEVDRYLLAVDNSKEKTQKAIIQAISNEVGSGQIISVQDNEMYNEEMKIMFSLDLDLRPSSLLVGEDDNPVDFEWTCERGLTQNVKLALKEFKIAEKLRPIKIVTYFPDSQPEPTQILQNLSKSYRIPIITPSSIFSQSELSLYNKDQKTLDEQTKSMFRKLKSRLSQNDCCNRGYILVNCPLFIYDAEIVFYNQKNRLKEAIQKEVVEGDDGEPAEQEQQQDEDGEEGEKKEDWYPESIIILKEITLKKQFQLSAFEFYKKRNLDVFIYDHHGQTDYEIQESLRVYVERNGRPHNYIKNEQQLKQEFDVYYEKVHLQIQDVKKEEQAQLKRIQEENQVVIQQLLEIVSKQVTKEVNDSQLNLKSSLRQFLMQNIVPTLSDGLLEVAKVQPSDPVEFLAEYLFEKSFDLQ